MENTQQSLIPVVEEILEPVMVREIPDHPYLLRGDTQYCLCVSGGRSSGYMLRKILDANNGLPDNAICVFNNTGKEREETLVFVNEMASKWAVDIVWLEYWFDDKAAGGRGDQKHKHKIVDFDSAGRDGEPFADLIKAKHYLPHTTQRICTSELKIETTRRYIKRELGWKSWRDVVGIRNDEQTRAQRMIDANCLMDVPMFWEKVTKQEVDNWWSANDFDLGIDSIYGNCDACFLKSRSNLIQLFRREPERAAWWVNMEKSVADRLNTANHANMNQFREDISMAQLLEYASSQEDLFPPEAGGSESVSCFCGD